MSANNGGALLEVRTLSKKFGLGRSSLSNSSRELLAVNAVSFAVAPGETYALVGESGCGKSTTAKLLLALEALSGGSIFFEGKSLAEFSREDWRRYRSTVQAVFQDPWSSLNPRMRVGNIVAEPIAALSHMSKAEVWDRVSFLLEEVGLARTAASRFPHEFSGGQRQRIAIARALSPSPKLIVLDEPVSSLDVSVRAQIMNLLKRIQIETGVGYLLIAHDLGTVRYLADRIGVMYLGRIVEEGPVRDILDAPKHPYTQALVASTLPIRIDGPNPVLATDIVVLKGEVPSPVNPPSGCTFHPRCPFAVERCSVETPNLRALGPHRRGACHLA